MFFAGWTAVCGVLLVGPGAHRKAIISPAVDSRRSVSFELLGLNPSRVEKVERAFTNVKGIKKYQIDVEHRKVSVIFDVQQTSYKRIKESLRQESLTPVL